MRVYGSDNIRNVAVIGHGASGKTTLVDALAFVAGSSKRHGSVPDGTALTDYTPDEIERQFSISLGLAHAEWMDSKINLIDAPGYLDFTGDALAAVYAADSAVVTVGATAGVEAGTELVWQYTTERGMPCLFVASMMDKENANFEDVLAGIKKHLTASVVPIQIPVGEGAEFKGIIDLFSKKCHMFSPGTKTGEYDEVDVPDEYQDRLEEYSQQLIEDIAATDEALMERYFEGEEISRDEMLAALKAGMAKGEVFPLLCCSLAAAFMLRCRWLLRQSQRPRNALGSTTSSRCQRRSGFPGKSRSRSTTWPCACAPTPGTLSEPLTRNSPSSCAGEAQLIRVRDVLKSCLGSALRRAGLAIYAWMVWLTWRVSRIMNRPISSGLWTSVSSCSPV